MILNTVDCTRPNNGRLPHGVDVMMSDFAGGASGFPMTFHGGKYTGESGMLLYTGALWEQATIQHSQNSIMTEKQCILMQSLFTDRKLEGRFHQEREEEAVKL